MQTYVLPERDLIFIVVNKLLHNSDAKILQVGIEKNRSQQTKFITVKLVFVHENKKKQS